ncbi:Pyruvate/2-oxoglutarate dehydrogenase complex, dihydrolipoamide dehydrogenase (E3) component [Thermanaeromonas toyohensis ToBE]|uniref:Pyruvate/2-oxoglutarate dehydrogenase complex, dihydrolipoamide dehydrogenase (E3) component n=1 Tax=Thermanaeromonas toyohensis ToBE TaxID=698762 RepID=A0A1W1W268_9FIRM|nr:NAD(P)/FAD-dependent oxidoreductase [Thermanaeromonas toyohensis]SMB99715.1 Pyruvate/2-oxoglutarate dehydrogenase complex, dihydrolipoamide dehydrogenase (E3) component [Thermanaeromonas toyohensis ToBE]
MKRTDILIIGGGLAGYTAAMAARGYFPSRKVTLVRKERIPLLPWGLAYACGRGELKKNLMHDFSLLDNGIEILIEEIKEIEPQGKWVSFIDSTQLYYDKLILATGSHPAPWPVKGHHLRGIYTLKKHLAYLRELINALDQAQDIVILGGGISGLQLAEACSLRGLRVTVVEREPHCLSSMFDEDLCSLIEERLMSQGIKVINCATIEEFYGKEQVQSVRISTGELLKAEVVVLAIGLVPNIDLAFRAGIEIGEGGIKVDEYLRTSKEDVFAVGDCASKPFFFDTDSSYIRRASMAGHEARVAAANLYGPKKTRKIRIDKLLLAIGGLALGSAGLTWLKAASLGIEAGRVDIKLNTYPGSPVVRMIYARDTGAILGVQIKGSNIISVREAMNSWVTLMEEGRAILNLPPVEETLCCVPPG